MLIQMMKKRNNGTYSLKTKLKCYRLKCSHDVFNNPPFESQMGGVNIKVVYQVHSFSRKGL